MGDPGPLAGLQPRATQARRDRASKKWKTAASKTEEEGNTRATTAGNIGRRAPGHAGILRHFIAPQPKWAPLAHSSAYNRGQHRAGRTWSCWHPGKHHCRATGVGSPGQHFRLQPQATQARRNRASNKCGRCISNLEFVFCPARQTCFSALGDEKWRGEGEGATCATGAKAGPPIFGVI